MARILIWMSPEPSHILPTLKFAQDLQMRGHTVTYHTCAGLHEQLRALSFECTPLLEGVVDSLPTVGLSSTTQSSGAWYSAVAGHFDDDRARAYKAISHDISAAAHATAADLVLIDGLMNYLYGIRAECAGRELRVGYVHTHLPFVVNGQNMARSPRMLRRADRTIILCPRELEIPEFLLEGGRYVEASIHLGRLEPPFPWDWLNPDRSLVYCGLGTQSLLYSDALEFLRALLLVAERMPDRQFAISAGPYARDLQPLAHANCKILSTVPQTAVLDRSALMILQGGLGSIKECLYFGVPMLVVPFLNDQPLNALRVCRHGLGLTVSPRQLNPDDLYGAVNGMLQDGRFARRAQQMQAAFKARERERLAASACEELLAEVGSARTAAELHVVARGGSR